MLRALTKFQSQLEAEADMATAWRTAPGKHSALTTHGPLQIAETSQMHEQQDTASRTARETYPFQEPP